MIDVHMAILCSYPTFDFLGTKFPLNYCDGIGLQVQIVIQALTTWVLYIITTIAVFNMILNAIFGRKPSMGMPVEQDSGSGTVDGGNYYTIHEKISAPSRRSIGQ